MDLSEFELIARLQELIGATADTTSIPCAIGIGDDGAVLDIPDGRQLVVCTDNLVSGVHFPEQTPPNAIGHKALAVNLSDLAAMGAEPAWFFMGLTLPSGDAEWLTSFAQGMAALASRCRIVLAGGDVASGPLNVCISALGLVDKNAALTRAGAATGDLVVVSGRLGGAANALRLLKVGGTPAASDRAALDFPEPRLALGRALHGTASACIDVSDGLLADLGHILAQSNVKGARLDAGRLPCPDSLAEMEVTERLSLQLSGGDDYELCFTIRPESRDRLAPIAAECGVDLTVVGSIVEQPGILVCHPDGSANRMPSMGYRHFGRTGEDGQ